MTLNETAAALNCEILQAEFEDVELSGAYTSDLLSDVMANAKSGGALITIQAHKNTVAVATLASLSVIIVCNSRPVPDDMIVAAREEGLAIFRSSESQFVISGKLYALLLPS
ncbi:hypothetical protein MASR2M78_13650 [Treponema sp.]